MSTATTTRTTATPKRGGSSLTPIKTYSNNSDSHGRRYSLLEDKRNHHRDKAQVLLKLAEAVDDSNQRRRKATAKAGRATVQDLRKLRDGLEQLQDQRRHGVSIDGLDIGNRILQTGSQPGPSDDTIQSTAQTVQAVVTAVCQLREHLHLQYQILEMKYFDIKRHAFDVEHQNRKLQLQLLESHGHVAKTKEEYSIASTSLSQAAQPSTPQTSSNTDTNGENHALVDQLQQENYELRQQLRESCGDCRKLVQENYGLRKILLDAGINFTALMHKDKDNIDSSERQQGHGSAGDEKEDDSTSQNASDNEEYGFEDAHEFSMDTVAEETATDLLSEENGFHIGSTSHEPGRHRTEGATLTSSITPGEKPSGISGSGTAISTFNTSTAASLLNISTSSLQSTSTTASSGSKRGSRRSVTFAAMANKLQTQRSLESNGTDEFENTSMDDEYSYAIAQSPTCAISSSRTKEEKDHDQNLALLGVGGLYAASTTPCIPVSTENTKSSKDERSVSKDSRRKSYSNFLMISGGSSDGNSKSSRSNKQHAPQKLRRRSHGDILRGRSRSSSSSSLKPSTQAMTAKELMKKSKKNSRSSSSSSRNRSNSGGTFNIQMSSVTPPRSTHQRMTASKPIDPLEEERRLSALLGGFSPGNIPLSASTSGSSTPTAAANTDSAAGTQRYPDYYTNDNDDAVSVSSVNSKGFFRRRSRRTRDDEDNMSVSSALSMGSLFSFKKKKKKKKSSASSVSSPGTGSSHRRRMGMGGDATRSVG